MTFRKFGRFEIGIDVDDTLIPEGVYIDTFDVDGFIPYLSEKWPPGGEPVRMELRLNPHTGEQLYHCMVFRIPGDPPPEPDPDVRRVDWDAMRRQVIADRPRKKRGKPETEAEELPDG